MKQLDVYISASQPSKSISQLLNSTIESEFNMWTKTEMYRSVKDERPKPDDEDDDFDDPPPLPKPTAKMDDHIMSYPSKAANKLNQSMEASSKQLIDHLISTGHQTTMTCFFQPVNSD
ncbi:hypothetical protein PGT21_018393 [Puccinia graminis f. sp. tritici]|uniref:Uncharacterized protein n=2 Tax=Puccinia graminis f. sp. tritici TaxID=56615 RepID=E3K014_PUCGT|nr:uncharacterized protein PGTG_03595 [Puccinia graminis f. sp. tritici CRL 75-36-700-3]EFP77639.2 hypothetical protein PGTG_03595 [Puccinia graminis f. sp. tritici CRL 75-36-700-3]KAA1110336.1 hypothetical protein PGT21_018393 [Puccinia graminis f. sp. tritici]